MDYIAITEPAFVKRDSFFTIGGTSIDPNGKRKVFLVKYDNHGIPIEYWKYRHPNFPQEDFIYLSDIKFTTENSIVISGNGTNQNGTSLDFLVLKIDSQGNEILNKLIGTIQWNEYAYKIINSGSGFIIGGLRNNTNVTTQDYTYRTLLVGIDSSGNVEWTWLSPESWGLRDAARDMVLLEDGSLVIASGIGHEQQRPSVNVVYFDKAVFKLNPQRELEWEVVFPDPELVMNSYTSRIIQLKNKSGFVVAGVAKRPTPPGVWGSNRGWIAKISPSGDSLWSRTYVYSANFPSFHEFYDLKECPDGGFILCGESRSVANGDSIPQQAWLMKLDSFGCLVPGCQLIDATEEAQEQGTLLLYPNPARDYLNFFYRPAPGQNSRELSFRIFDASGRELQRFEAQSGEATYIVPLWHWPPGVYFLQLLHEGLPVRTERFVVGR